MNAVEESRDAYQGIERLMNAKGTKEKEQILLQMSGNQRFCRLLYYALNPMLSYGLSEKTLAAVTPSDHYPFGMGGIGGICDMLSVMRRGVDKETARMVRRYLDSEFDWKREIDRAIVTKTLRLGVTAKTVNKVIPGLIPEWEVQQAYLIENHPIPEGAEFAVTQKLNGVRSTYYNGRLYARSGTPFTGLDHITDTIEALFDHSFVLDGELLLKPAYREGKSDNECFREVTGIVNSDTEKKDSVCLTVYDTLTATDFENGGGLSYFERRKILEGLDKILVSEGVTDVCVLPLLYRGTDQSVIPELLDRMVREDKEGLMVNLDAPYKRARHKGILKVKRFHSVDLPILRCEEGGGRLSGTLGAFVLSFDGNEVSVGSGFTDAQRRDFWDRREELPGTLCEVKYKEVSADKHTGAKSLQFPVFLSLRPDKTSPNEEV